MKRSGWGTFAAQGGFSANSEFREVEKLIRAILRRGGGRAGDRKDRSELDVKIHEAIQREASPVTRAARRANRKRERASPPAGDRTLAELERTLLAAITAEVGEQASRLRRELQTRLDARLGPAAAELRDHERHRKTLESRIERRLAERIDRKAQRLASQGEKDRREIERQLATELEARSGDQAERIAAAARDAIDQRVQAAEHAVEQRVVEADRERRRRDDGLLDRIAQRLEAHSAKELERHAEAIESRLLEELERRTKALAREHAQQIEGLRTETAARLEEGRQESEGVHQRAARVLDESEALGQQLLGLAGHLHAEHASLPPPKPDGRKRRRRLARKAILDLNGATADELRALGLSLTQTRRILKARDSLGGFASLDQLDEIPGLSRGLLATLHQQLNVRTQT